MSLYDGVCGEEEGSAVSVEFPRLNPDWLASSRLCFDRNEDNWLKTTRSSVFTMNGRRKTCM